MATAQQLLAIEAKEIGYSRWNDPQTGTKYGRWYAEKTGSSWFGANGVAFCAMGQSWSFAQAGMNASNIGIPTAGCGDIRNAARKNGKTVDKHSAKPGDLVLFRWDGNVNDMSYSDHVGMVEKNLGNSGIQTIEFNTNNGQVCRRTRSWGYVQLIVRPDYDNASSGGSSSGGSSSGGSSSKGSIEVDGLWGSGTTTLAQKLAGTYVDGAIDGQNPQNKKYLGGCTTGWRWVSPTGSTGGSPLITNMMQKLKAKGYYTSSVDGLAGKGFANAMIGYFRDHWNSGATVQDGKLDAGGVTLRAFQKMLNAGKWFN